MLRYSPPFLTITTSSFRVLPYAPNKPIPPTIRHIVTVSAKARHPRYTLPPNSSSTHMSKWASVALVGSRQWASPFHMVKKAEGS